MAGWEALAMGGKNRDWERYEAVALKRRSGKGTRARCSHQIAEDGLRLDAFVTRILGHEPLVDNFPQAGLGGRGPWTHFD